MDFFYEKINEFNFFDVGTTYTPEDDSIAKIAIYKDFANLVIILDENKVPYDFIKLGYGTGLLGRIPKDYGVPETIYERYEGAMEFQDTQKFLKFLGYEKEFQETLYRSAEISGFYFASNYIYGEHWVKKSVDKIKE